MVAVVSNYNKETGLHGLYSSIFQKLLLFMQGELHSQKEHRHGHKSQKEYLFVKCTIRIQPSFYQMRNSSDKIATRQQIQAVARTFN